MAGETQTGQSTDPRPSTVVVTSENLAEFQARKLGIEPPASGEPKSTTAPKGEQAGKGDQAQGQEQDPAQEALEDEKAAEKDPKRHKLNLRFSELTDKRKAAEQARDVALETARREREARLAAEQERDQLRKGPAKGDEANEQPPADANQDPPRPDRAKFKAGPEGDAAFDDALWDWRQDKRDRARARETTQRQADQAEQERLGRWRTAQEAVRADIPDYDAKIKASTAVLSDEATDAVLDMEGDTGARVLYYFSEFPQEAERLGKLSVKAMLRELGKIEAKVAKPKGDDKGEQKGQPKAAAGEVEVSKAPAPAKPLGSTSGPEPLEDEKGNLRPMSHKEYKAARKAGKIK